MYVYRFFFHEIVSFTTLYSPACFSPDEVPLYTHLCLIVRNNFISSLFLLSTKKKCMVYFIQHFKFYSSTPYKEKVEPPQNDRSTLQNKNGYLKYLYIQNLLKLLGLEIHKQFLE